MSLKAEGKDSKDSFEVSAKDSKNTEDNEEEILYSDYKVGEDNKEDAFELDVPLVTITAIDIRPQGIVPVTAPIDLSIQFELDRDVVAAYWVVQFLVDSCHSRLINVLGETNVEDYPDGESDMHFSVSAVNVDNIEPSQLTNSGLLMAIFMVNGKEVACVNMVSYLF
jgi:hypothetical protein